MGAEGFPARLAHAYRPPVRAECPATGALLATSGLAPRIAAVAHTHHFQHHIAVPDSQFHPLENCHSAIEHSLPVSMQSRNQPTHSAD